jgi:hypothetical protein
MMLTLLVANPQNTISHLLVFLLAICLFSIYVGSTLIFFHNGSSVCIILCILCRLLCCVVTACENLSVVIHIVMAKCKCSINDSIKSEYLFIKGANENAECMLCNMKFLQCTWWSAGHCQSCENKKHKLAVQNKSFYYCMNFLSAMFIN